jgi:hypothetical protein
LDDIDPSEVEVNSFYDTPAETSDSTISPTIKVHVVILFSKNEINPNAFLATFFTRLKSVDHIVSIKARIKPNTALIPLMI